LFPAIDAATVETVSKPKPEVIELKVEERLIIDSMSVDKNDPPMFSRAKRSSDIFILVEKPQLKMYRFKSDGTLLNRFLSKGEGPGEVKYVHNFQPLNHTLLVTAYEKLIFFNLDGTVKQERKFNQEAFHSIFLDNGTYLNKIITWDDSKQPTRTVALFNQKDDKPIATLCQHPDRRDLGITVIKGPNFENWIYHLWITPDYRYTYLPATKHIVTALSDGKILHLKDLDGKILKTVKLDIPDLPFDQKEKTLLAEDMAIFKNRAPEVYNGLIKRIPKNFFPIMALKPLPKNHFALFTPSGYKKFDTIKVFDQNLNLLHHLKLPKTITDKLKDPNKLNFFPKGLYLIDNTDDENRYIEYHIKNLNPIFN
jgi:hypothetical protein